MLAGESLVPLSPLTWTWGGCDVGNIVCTLFGHYGVLWGSTWVASGPSDASVWIRQLPLSSSMSSWMVILEVFRRLPWVLFPVVRAVYCPCSFSRAIRDVLDATLRLYNTTFPPRLRGSSSSGCAFPRFSRLCSAYGCLREAFEDVYFCYNGCGRVVARQTSCGPE